MTEKKYGPVDGALIWFGAGVSIAEILTGTYLAPLGLEKGLWAILAGHLIGGLVMFLVGLISARRGTSAMEAVKLTFGRKGGLFFAALNVLQLVGWTAIMIYDGALAAAETGLLSRTVAVVLIGVLILAWIGLGITHLKSVNSVAMVALFALTVLLSRVVFKGTAAPASVALGGLSFGAALELSAAMPLSWLPVVGDYTGYSSRPVLTTLVSVVVYNLVSCWMYLIGLGTALYAGGDNIALIMVRAGVGTVGLLVILLSTVTTTFLDAFSAGISAQSLCPKWRGKIVGLIVTVLGTAAACLWPMDDITDFLLLIGSVFAPMCALQIAHQLLWRKEAVKEDWSVTHLGLWVLGFLMYRWLLHVDTPLGNTFPAVVLLIVLTGLVYCFGPKKVKN